MAAWFEDAAQLAPPRVLREDLDGGAFVLRSPEPLGEPVRCIGEWLERWAKETPDAMFIAERDTPDSWRRLSYAQVRAATGAVGQWLIDARLPAGKPVVILSDNAIDHALLANGAAINGTGKTVALELYDAQNGKVDVTGKVAWLDQAGGTTRYSPATGDLLASLSPYKARWKVTDGAGKVVFFPNREADVWTVRR